MGIGYDDTVMEEKRHPTRADLDAVSTEHPIIIMHISFHLAVMNSKALQMAGINEDTPDPEGGHIQREANSNRPNGVLEETVDRMEELGARRDDIVAVIGPAISQQAYEVGPEFLDDFMADDPENHRFFANGEGDRYQFDLPSFGLHRLRQAGVGHAEWTRHCTYSDAGRFYSYRRATHAGEADYGRLMAAIRL